jgi:hypothetical protein
MPAAHALSQAHQRLRALQQEHEELVRANLERISASTEAVDKATAALAASSESIRLKNLTLRKNEQRVASIDRELGEAPATQRTLVEVRSACLCVQKWTVSPLVSRC